MSCGLPSSRKCGGAGQIGDAECKAPWEEGHRAAEEPPESGGRV